jgi:hypothetical protein
MREFFISTNVPAFAPASRTVPAKVTEWPHQRTCTDRRVDRDHVRGRSRRRRRPSGAAQHRERVTTAVGLEVTPGRSRRRRVDDRHAREHVRLVDPVAEHGGGDGQLRPRVDPEARASSGQTRPRRAAAATMCAIVSVR